MSLARVALWSAHTLFRPVTSAHLPKTRIAEQHSQAIGDRLELLDAAILCKLREKVVSARAHDSLQEGEYVDEADPSSSFAIRIRQFDLHEFQFS
jgi:hypothetical protein